MADSTNYFSWDNISEIAGIDSHLEFASSLVEKYNWDADVRCGFLTSLERIREKQQDKQLNISVVGEFSTGKSTFLNALLGAELLTSASLQGTTLATTVIEYGETLGVTARYLNGAAETKTFQTMEELRRCLSDLTTETDTAKRCKSVSVTLPSANLSNGFRFIDTPGTNAMESWHEQVTVNALRELSDLSVILVNATQPLPESLCRFISNNLSDVLSSCVFVVTKIDLVPKAEREMVLRYIGQKIKNTFDLKDAPVIPYVSTAVLANRLANSAEDLELLSRSYQGEVQLLRLAATKRATSQARKLLTLIDQMYVDISEKMNSLSDSYKSQLAELLRSRQIDLNVFLNQQMTERTGSFDTSSASLRSEAVNYYQSSADSARNSIMADIANQHSIDSLRIYVLNEMTAECNRRSSTISQSFREWAHKLNGLYKQELNTFHNKFESSFHDLAVLEANVPMTTLQLPIPEVNAAGFSGGAQYIQGEQKKENNSMAFWVIVCAIVGTLIFPVVGTIIGIFVGTSLAKKFSPTTADVRSTSAGQLAVPVRQYFTSVSDTMTQGFDKYRRDLKKMLEQEIRRYSSQYNEIVQRRIAKENSRRQGIENSINAIQQDLISIDNRKKQLDEIVRQIDIAGGL